MGVGRAYKALTMALDGLVNRSRLITLTHLVLNLTSKTNVSKKKVF